MDNLPYAGDSGKRDLKSIWSKPEGKATILVGAGIGCVIFYYWGVILPFLIMTLQNTLYFGFLLGILGLLVFLFTNKQFRTMIWYLWKTLMRGLAGLIIQIDPIAILKTYISDLEKKQDEMSEKITELAGSKEKLGAKIQKNNEEADDLLRKAAKAKEMDKMEAAQLNVMRAGGLKSMNEKLMPLYANMQKLHEFLEKAYKASDFVIKQAKIQVELKEAEYDAIKSSSAALRSAMTIFKGDPDKRAMFEQSLEYIQDDMAKKVAEMKRIVDLSAEFIDNADIESGVNYDKGMALLDEYMHGQKLSFMQNGPDLSTPSLSTQQPVKVLLPNQTKGNGSEWD
jgi:cell division septum initiation protein DivIVA